MTQQTSFSISSKLILVIISLSVMTLLAVSIFNFYTSDRILKQRVEDQLISESTGRGTAIRSLIETRIQQIHILAADNDVIEALRSGNGKAQYEKLSDEFRSFRQSVGYSIGLDDIRIIGRDGLAAYSMSGSDIGADFSGDERFKRGMSESFLDFDFVDGKRKLVVVVPVTEDGDPASPAIGVIMASTDTVILDDILLNRKGLGETGEIYLVNADRMMISESRFIENAAFVQEANTLGVRQCFDEGVEVNAVYPDYRGIPIVGFSYCARDLGFVLLAEIDEAEIFQPIVNLRNELLGIGILLTGLIVAVAVVVSMGITKPITKLRDAADRIEKGEYGFEIDVKSSDEVGALARQFESMRKNILQNSRNLNELVRERTKDLTDIMNALDATAIVAVTDKNGNITRVNQKFVEISGYSEKELIGQNHRILKSGHHPPEFFESMWQTISSGKIFEGEIKNMAKDGSHYWVKTTIVPFLDENGNPEQYIAIHDDITKLKDIEEELKVANLELQKKDKLKDEFLGMASHELKTPLTPILGWCDALKSQRILGEMTKPQLAAVETIEKNAVKLEKMISDMLDVQKLELSEMRFNLADVDVDKILKTIQKDFEFTIKEKSIEFTVSARPGITLRSDEARVTQVLSALIYNSVDFVPERDGRISVLVEERGDDVVFCVKDNGPGIPLDKQKHLFKKFYQVDTSLTRKHGGTGLGLVISKGIIEGLGGRIWVDTDMGKGSSFYFSLPRRVQG